MRPLKLLVLIPCLNEEDTIYNLVKDVPVKIEGIDAIEILVIDDGSKDETFYLAKKAGATVIRNERNRGLGNAFKVGINYAVGNNFDFLVNIDGDRQFEPDDIAKLLNPILLGEAGMVTASRFVDKSITPNMPTLKRFGNYAMSLLVSRLVGQRFYDVSCGFRCYSRDAIMRLNLHGGFTYTQESFIDFIFKGVVIREVPVSVVYYEERISRMANNIPKYAYNCLKIIIRAYSDHHPLRFFWGVSGLLAMPGIFFGAQFITHFIEYGSFRGYLFSGFLSAFFSALATIFFVCGIMADILIRMRITQEELLYNIKSGGSGTS